jgi:hypothetical protein
MNSKKPRSRRQNEPGKSSQPLNVRLAAFQKSVSRQFKENQRQQKLRRQRRERLQSKPAENQRWIALRKALNFTWLQRRLKRREQIRDRQRSGTARGSWFWPRIAENLSTHDAAARVARSAAAAMLLLNVVTLVISAVPLKVTTPNWYLEVLALIGESVPVLVISCLFALLSLTLDSNNSANMPYRNKLLSFSRLGYILALLLLPLQLSCVAWLYGDTFNSNRIQRNSIISTSEALIVGAQQTTSKEQLVEFLRSRNINISLGSIAAAPLGQVKTQFISSVKAGRQQQENALNANFRSTNLRYAAGSLRVFIALAILAAFLRVFQAVVRRSSMQSLTANQPFEEELDQQPDPQPEQSELSFISDSN